MAPDPAAFDTRRRRYELEFADEFDGADLDRTRWLPYYLPHWSSRRRAAARYALRDSCLRLRVDVDQEPWCPELDGETRVSSLQTGVFAGSVGTRVGQHRFHPEAVVREAQANVGLYTPRYGRVEIRCRAVPDPAAMVALWLIGYEDEPERSGELCVCEIFGRDVGQDGARIGVGIHPFGDPQLRDDFAVVQLPIDATDFHEYAAEWEPGRSRFLVDGRVVHETEQAPDYPLQLMLGLYRFSAGSDEHEFVVDRVRGYRLAEQPAGVS
ncbi:MAG TPA: glycoside hydrolase family 16 protein [Gaiellaceae bacterium]|nr:glycoside hydrolase family 16 protein [Gaiellaceae bacterium]